MKRTSLTRYSSPLRYPGGKAKLANYIKLVMIQNGLVGREYVEPYAGGASVGLALLYEGYTPHIHMNDLNPGVHAFWFAVLNETEALCDLITNTPVTVSEWRRQRSVQAKLNPSPLELGFSTFYLNRTNRSGIINGGVIGGINQQGQWKIDARYNASDLVRRIRKVGRHRSQISLTSIDARTLIDQWSDDSLEPAFLYLDPPYFIKGEGLYDNFYDPSDHSAIESSANSLAHPWLVSYDAVPEILELYRKYKAVRYSLRYSANLHSEGTEVVVFSDDLRIPDLSPRSVTSRHVDAARLCSLETGFKTSS